MMRMAFAMVLVAAMVMMTGTCTLAENVITRGEREDRGDRPRVHAVRDTFNRRHQDARRGGQRP